MNRNSSEITKKQRSMRHHILTGIGIVLCVIFIPMLALNCMLIVKSFFHKDQVPNIGGVFPMIILTDSMKPEFSSGDLIICRNTDAESVQKGDIICFFDPDGNGSTMVTHRVMSVTTDDNGEIAWETKGDVNNTKDSSLVPAKNLVGVYQSCIPGMGRIAMFTQTPRGMILCVLCPIMILIVYDSIRRRKEEAFRKKDTDALLEELETLRAERKQMPADVTAIGGEIH